MRLTFDNHSSRRLQGLTAFTGVHADKNCSINPGLGAARRCLSAVPRRLLSSVLPLLLLGVLCVSAQADTQPPTVVSRSPIPGAISQSVKTNVTATFSV